MGREIESMNSRCLASLRMSHSGEHAQLIITTKETSNDTASPSSSTCVEMHLRMHSGIFKRPIDGGLRHADRSYSFASLLRIRGPLSFHICRSQLLVESIIRGPIVTVHVHAMHARIATPDKWEIPSWPRLDIYASDFRLHILTVSLHRMQRSYR